MTEKIVVNTSPLLAFSKMRAFLSDGLNRFLGLPVGNFDQHTQCFIDGFRIGKRRLDIRFEQDQICSLSITFDVFAANSAF